jgi:hypothetical protein
METQMKKIHSILLTNEEVEITLRALEVFALDMHNVATVCGDPESIEEAKVAESLMSELESYLQSPDDN